MGTPPWFYFKKKMMSRVFEYFNGNQVKNFFYLPELDIFLPTAADTITCLYIQSVMEINNSALLHASRVNKNVKQIDFGRRRWGGG